MKHITQVRFWAYLLITGYGIYRVESGQADNETVLIVLAVIWISYSEGMSLSNLIGAFIPQISNKKDAEYGNSE